MEKKKLNLHSWRKLMDAAEAKGMLRKKGKIGPRTNKEKQKKKKQAILLYFPAITTMGAHMGKLQCP